MATLLVALLGTPEVIWAQQSESQTAQGEEVLVTAQKRVENLQDVPVPVSVISADALVASNQALLRDYYATIPGLDLSPNIEGNQSLSIRGITTGGLSHATVGVLIDDVPFGGSSDLGVPDIDPGDLARIEVLRGPQGTLYGASSMGGLLKFVTVDPNPDSFSGRVEAGGVQSYNGNGLGYTARGLVNVPIDSTFAVRASAFTRLEPGYVDNPTYQLNGVNEARAYGGRLSSLWQPSDNLSLRLSALYQSYRTNGSSEVNWLPGLGDWQQSYLPGTGSSTRRVQAYSMNLKVKFSGAELTSLTGYNINDYSDSNDFTSALGEFLTVPQFGVSGTPWYDRFRTYKISQELRLAGLIGQRIDWLVGAYYTHEGNPQVQSIAAADTTGAIVGQGLYFDIHNSHQEYAGFLDLTYHLTDRFDVQVGGRESRIRETYAEVDTGLETLAFDGGPPPFIIPAESETASAFTYLVTPRFTVSRSLMMYARFASGYRPGGFNFPAGGAPAGYGPDKTQSYEAGLKGEFLDHAFIIDTSIYYIDWKNIQINLITPPPIVNSYAANASRAKSEGIELSLKLRPVSGLTVSAWGDYDNAVLTENFPGNSATYGVAGDRLPNTPRFSGNLTVDEEFHLAGNLLGFVGGTVSHVGDRKGILASIFSPSNERQDFPAYTKADLKIGLKTGSWTASLYTNNLGNTRGLIGGGTGYFNPNAYIYIPPRTIGVNLMMTF